MKSGSATEGSARHSAWPPEWLEARLLPDSRFARAYEALGDRRRALVKRVIAAQFALHPPVRAVRTNCRDVVPSGSTRNVTREPRPFVLLLCGAGLDAPALLLAALLPVLAARPAEVLVARLGKAADVPKGMLAACELAGQERLVALGARGMTRLVCDAANCGLPGLILYQGGAEFGRLLTSAPVRAALDASAELTLCGLRPPSRPGVWQGESAGIDMDEAALLYGSLPFTIAEASCEGPEDFSAECDLLLLPDAFAGRSAAQCTVGSSQLGMFCWPQLSCELLTCCRSAYFSAP